MKHSHYHKSVKHLASVDIYRVLDLFGVTDPCVQHAVKKLLCAGQRGSKGKEQDIREAVDTLNRALQMMAEDDTAVPPTLDPFGPVDRPLEQGCLAEPTQPDPMPGEKLYRTTPSTDFFKYGVRYSVLGFDDDLVYLSDELRCQHSWRVDRLWENFSRNAQPDV